MTVLTAWGRLLRLPSDPERDQTIAALQSALNDLGVDQVGRCVAGAFDATAWIEALEGTVDQLASRLSLENEEDDAEEALDDLFHTLDEIMCATCAAGLLGVEADTLLPLEKDLWRAQETFDDAADLFQDQSDYIERFWSLFRSNLRFTDPGLYHASRHFRSVLRALGRAAPVGQVFRGAKNV